MDFIKDVVDVQISNVTGNTYTTDLNTILILAQHSQFTAPEMFRVYTDATQVSADGFAKTSYVYKAVQLAFSQQRRPARIVVGAGVGEDADYLSAFEKMQMISQGWLWLVSDLRDPAKQLELAKAVSATEKYYAIGTSDPNALVAGNATDIGSLISANQLPQAYAWYDDEIVDTEVPNPSEIALLARCAGNVAGTVQFLMKELVGIPDPKSIDTPTKQSTLLAKGYTFPAVGNKKVYSYGSGKLGNGDWIDIGLTITWLRVNMREEIFNTVTAEDKLGMDNDGAATIEGRVRSVLMRGRDLNMVAKDTPIVVTSPDVTTMQKAERAGRRLPRVKFSCRLTGAIVGTQVLGEVWE